MGTIRVDKIVEAIDNRITQLEGDSKFIIEILTKRSGDTIPGLDATEVERAARKVSDISIRIEELNKVLSLIRKIEE